VLARTKDQRSARRRPTNRLAKICHEEGGSEVYCRIVDISDGGARLMLTRHLPLELPDQFMLFLSLDGRVSLPCNVVWRDARQVDVKFTG
jgi:PilZ domain